MTTFLSRAEPAAAPLLGLPAAPRPRRDDLPRRPRAPTDQAEAQPRRVLHHVDRFDGPADHRPGHGGMPSHSRTPVPDQRHRIRSASGGRRSRRGPRRRRRRPRRGRPPSAGARRDAPWTTPSATAHACCACSALDTPTPTSTGTSVIAFSRPASAVADGRQRVALARHAEQPDGVDEAAAAGGDPRQALVGRGRRGEHHRLDAGLVGGRAPRAGLLERAGRAGCTRRCRPRRRSAGEALVAVVVHEVVVRHHRRAGCSTSRLGSLVEDRQRAWRPASSAACDACWITGPSITGSENGMPISIAVGAVGGRGPDRVLPARVAAGDVRHEQLAAGVALGAELRLEPSASSGRGRRLVSRGCPSSGRRPCRRGPDRFTSTVWPWQRRRLADDPGHGVRRLERGDDALGAGQQLERLDHLGVGDASGTRPARSTRGTSAPGRRPGSRGRRRSTAPPRPGRTRPASGSCASRARRRARRGRRPRRRPARRRPGGRRCRRTRRRCPIAFEPPPTQATTTSGSPPEQRRGTARAPRRRSPGGTGAPSTGTDAAPSPSRGSSACRRPWPPSRASPR